MPPEIHQYTEYKDLTWPFDSAADDEYPRGMFICAALTQPPASVYTLVASALLPPLLQHGQQAASR